MKKIKLFGNNVMLKQVPKGGGMQLHLPENMKDETKQKMFDLVVAGIGKDVKSVKVGDVVMAHCPPSCVQYNPATEAVCMVIQEGMIQGVVVGS